MPATTTKPPTLDDCKPTMNELEPRTIIVTGITGSGKTTLAATAFADLGDPLAGKIPPKPITLKGAVWLAADEQGTVALKSRRILPEYEIDVRKLTQQAGGDVGQALRWVHSLLKDAADKGAFGLIWDTVSTLGDFLVGWFVHGDGCPTTGKGERNIMRAWGVVGDQYRQLYEVASALNYRQIVLAHPKANAAEEDAADPRASKFIEAKATVKGTPGDNYIVPAVAGQQFAKFLNGANSLSGWLRTKDRNGKRERIWMPFGGEGSQGKNRYEHILDREEPADLAALDRKILASVNGKDG